MFFSADNHSKITYPPRLDRLEIMKSIEYINKIREKTSKLNKMAQNPFIQPKSYNPFESAFFQTYVWVEKNQEKEIICDERGECRKADNT